MLWHSAEILKGLGQPVEAAEYAGIYIRYFLPGAFMYCQIECLRRFLVAQGVFDFVPKIQIFTTILHPLWLYLFVHILDWSIEGVALASTVTHSLNFFIAYIWV